MGSDMINKNLENRIILVTGASRGIGAAVARKLATEGAQLILTARTTGGLEEVDDEIKGLTGQSSTLVPMDLRQFDQIDNLGHAIYERFGKLDAVIGNAAFLAELTPTWLMDPDAWSRMIDVNVTANARLIRSMDPLLRQSDSGRAVFVTDSQGQVPRPYWSFYGATKAALENIVQAYAQEVEKTNIKVNLLNPGPVATAMRLKVFPGEDSSQLATPDDVSEAFVKLDSADCTINGEIVSAQ
jgi:NAD(P)-dependent dehydrogenase (short-subunit alcohol dehydrogenase family)